MDASRLVRVLSDDYIGANGEEGPAGFETTIKALRMGFPDIRFTLEDVIADADRVAVRWTWRATHLCQFRTFAATGKTVTTTGIAIYQIRNDTLVRSWLETDRLGALQQIGPSR